MMSLQPMQRGWALLRYRPGNDVGFEVVRSVLHDDTAHFDLAELSWDIGQVISDTYHEAPLPGYIHTVEGDRYDWEIYDGKEGDPPEYKTGQIFGVNVGLLEVWWYNLSQRVPWPSLVKRYRNVWPTTPEEIVIASTLGSGPLDPVSQRNARIYYQNNTSQAGFNPNDEHALIGNTDTGEAVFALRNDLGTSETSDPYVLLKSQQAEGDLWDIGSSRSSQKRTLIFSTTVG